MTWKTRTNYELCLHGERIFSSETVKDLEPVGNPESAVDILDRQKRWLICDVDLEDYH